MRILLALLVSLAAGEVRAELRAGAAAIDVTPLKFPVLVNGGMLSRSIDTVKSPIYARAIVLDDGKTRLGIDVAHRLRSEIISADSRQVYRGLDIGSGKDLSEYRAVDPPVPYHLIDVADPEEIYSVFCFQRDCYALFERKTLEQPFASGVPLVYSNDSPGSSTGCSPTTPEPRTSCTRPLASVMHQ